MRVLHNTLQRELLKHPSLVIQRFSILEATKSLLILSLLLFHYHIVPLSISHLPVSLLTQTFWDEGNYLDSCPSLPADPDSLRALSPWFHSPCEGPSCWENNLSPRKWGFISHSAFLRWISPLARFFTAWRTSDHCELQKAKTIYRRHIPLKVEWSREEERGCDNLHLNISILTNYNSDNVDYIYHQLNTMCWEFFLVFYLCLINQLINLNKNSVR